MTQYTDRVENKEQSKPLRSGVKELNIFMPIMVLLKQHLTMEILNMKPDRKLVNIKLIGIEKIKNH